MQDKHCDSSRDCGKQGECGWWSRKCDKLDICNSFSVGGQIIPQIIPKDEINSQDSISNLQDLCKEVVTCSDCGQFAYDPCTLELQNALRRDLNIPRAIYCTNYWKHNANGDRIQCLYDPTDRECKLPSRVESGH